ncbi:hypothetical protein ADUPG1_004216, partial [Aduncisulcus paluster]
ISDEIQHALTVLLTLFSHGKEGGRSSIEVIRLGTVEGDMFLSLNLSCRNDILVLPSRSRRLKARSSSCCDVISLIAVIKAALEYLSGSLARGM